MKPRKGWKKYKRINGRLLKSEFTSKDEKLTRNVHTKDFLCLRARVDNHARDLGYWEA